MLLSSCSQHRGVSSATHPAVQPFMERVQAYMELHGKLEKQVPPLKDKAEPEQIAAHKQALAAAIRAARKDARPGDIFVPAARPWFIQAVRASVKGAGGAAERRTIMDENPRKPREPTQVQVKVAVNAVYPAAAPLSTVPPTLLLELPTLPPELEYRFVGRALILRDVKANLIVDYIPNVLPPA